MKYIGGIDLLRFIGAMSVIALHLHLVETWPAAIGNMFNGNDGVILFYVISGFLITSLICQEVQVSGRFDAPRFFMRRVLRIFPLYYTALLCYVLADVIGIHKLNYASFGYALSYAYNFVPRSIYLGWLGSYHTLATEEHFYLLYPLLWLVCLRLRMPAWLIILVLLAVSPIFLLLSRPFAESFFIYRWTFNAWSPILVGCLFGFYYSSQKTTHSGTLSFLAGFLILFPTQLMYDDTVILAISFGLLVLHFAYNQERVSVRAVSGPIFRYLGAISYGLYIWQSFILATASNQAIIREPWLAIVVIFALAIASWHLVERPLSQLRHRIRPKAAAYPAQLSGEGI